MKETKKNVKLNKFFLKNIVYLITDPDQKERMIVGIMTTQEGVYTYRLAEGSNTYWAEEYELSDVKIIKK